MTPARVAIIVISMNDAPWLGPCLDALAASLGQPFSIAVVANNCTDSTHEVCTNASMPVTVFRTESRVGYAGANNLALRWVLAEHHDYVMLLNADTVIHTDCVLALTRFLDQRPEYGVAGSLQYEYADLSWSVWNDWSQVTVRHAQELGSKVLESDGFTWLDHNYVQGAALMFRVSSIPRVGLLDPLYGSFYEETDLCRRHLLAGLKTAIVFNSKVRHFGGGNWRASVARRAERDFLFLRNQFFYYLSGERSVIAMLNRLLWLLLRHYRAIRYGREDVSLRWWQYLRVLDDALRNYRFVRQLAIRNRLIRIGRPLPQQFWSIGRP